MRGGLLLVSCCWRTSGVLQGLISGSVTCRVTGSRSFPGHGTSPPTKIGQAPGQPRPLVTLGGDSPTSGTCRGGCIVKLISLRASWQLSCKKHLSGFDALMRKILCIAENGSPILKNAGTVNRVFPGIWFHQS